MKTARTMIVVLLAFILGMLSACGAKKKETPAAGTSPVPGETVPAAELKGKTSPTYSEQDVLFPSEGHPPYAETHALGGESMTDFGMARSKAVLQDQEALLAYLESHQDSPLAVHFAGTYTGDINLDWALVIRLDEPENKALLDEIAGIGLKTDYRIMKGAGTQAYLEASFSDIREKLDALCEKVKNGTASNEEKELISHYRIGQPSLAKEMGQICVEVVIKTPWYSVGENWTEADMFRDLEHCKELFYKLIGRYDDVVAFGYPV